jgi:LmbE family N-acetylglucosaminyl deacetylase
MKKPSILFVFAHPDDESFAVGGSIVHYSSEQVTTHLYCATKGGAGKPGSPPLCTLNDLPEYRAKELEKACRLLGVDHLYLRQFEDGKLEESCHELAEDILSFMKKINPDVVVTFPPHGISGHSDHIQVQKICYDLLSRHSIPCVQSLYYVTRETENLLSSSPPFGHTCDQMDVIIDVNETRSQVAQALKAHQTQHLSVARVFPGIFENRLDSIPSKNYYVIGWETDLTYKKRLNHPRPHNDLFF